MLLTNFQFTVYKQFAAISLFSFLFSLTGRQAQFTKRSPSEDFAQGKKFIPRTRRVTPSLQVLQIPNFSYSPCHSSQFYKTGKKKKCKITSCPKKKVRKMDS